MGKLKELKELKEEVRAMRRCLEEVMVLLRGRCAGAGGEREDGEEIKESKR